MILVTGGAGYIGSHSCVELLAVGQDVVVVDNLSNSSKVSIERIQKISGCEITFVEGDICNKSFLRSLFAKFSFSAVIHFAGLKSVNESVTTPYIYYQNNVVGSFNLLEIMKEYNCKRFVFSSSATVYGDPVELPINEEARLNTTNPYGTTKLVVENMLRDFCTADSDLSVAILRYFNPVGAHPSSLIGEDPCGVPNNLFPFISRVAIGTLNELNIFGNDYSTPDGTGIRDYIHVVDLARGHVDALRYLRSHTGASVFNLGTGRGYSVLDIVKTFEKVTGRNIPYKISNRRPGDIGACYADPSYAESELQWKAQFGIEEMCQDTWNWQVKNPHGFTD